MKPAVLLLKDHQPLAVLITEFTEFILLAGGEREFMDEKFCGLSTIRFLSRPWLSEPQKGEGAQVQQDKDDNDDFIKP
jgi:hypothetical protein